MACLGGGGEGGGGIEEVRFFEKGAYFDLFIRL